MSKDVVDGRRRFSAERGALQIVVDQFRDEVAAYPPDQRMAYVVACFKEMRQWMPSSAVSEFIAFIAKDLGLDAAAIIEAYTVTEGS